MKIIFASVCLLNALICRAAQPIYGPLPDLSSSQPAIALIPAIAEQLGPVRSVSAPPSLRITWRPSIAADRYNVYVYAKGVTNGVRLASTTSTNLPVSSIGGKRFAVTASNQGIESDLSAIVPAAMAKTNTIVELWLQGAATLEGFTNMSRILQLTNPPGVQGFFRLQAVETKQ